MWRSWLAHLVWDQRVLCSSHSTPTKEIKVFDFGLFFMSAHLRAGDVSRTEDASGAAGGCFWHGTPLKMRRVPQKPVFGTEYLFRTVEACFLHRTPLKMRRVPQEAFFSTARMFRTVEGGGLVRRASENASHLVVRSTGKRVAVASERPVYPRTGQRQVAAAAEPGVHFSRPHSGYEVATPPQR